MPSRYYDVRVYRTVSHDNEDCFLRMRVLAPSAWHAEEQAVQNVVEEYGDDEEYEAQAEEED